MTHEELLREFAALPPEDQRRVVDYIASLRERYEHASPAGASEYIELTQEGFVGMWHDRAEMLDSSAWVREKRVREWVKQSG